MASFTISGDIHDTNIEKLGLSISEALEIDNVKISVDNIYIENETFSLYIFEFKPFANIDNNWDFLISSSYEGCFEDIEKFLKNIARSLYKSNIKFEFEFYGNEENADNSSWVMRYPDYYSGNHGIFIDFQDKQIY